jgi:hypothetical protein
VRLAPRCSFLAAPEKFAAPSLSQTEQLLFLDRHFWSCKTSELFETMSVDVLELSVPSRDYRHVLVVQDM